MHIACVYLSVREHDNYVRAILFGYNTIVQLSNTGLKENRRRSFALWSEIGQLVNSWSAHETVSLKANISYHPIFDCKGRYSPGFIVSVRISTPSLLPIRSSQPISNVRIVEKAIKVATKMILRKVYQVDGRIHLFSILANTCVWALACLRIADGVLSGRARATRIIIYQYDTCNLKE